MKNYKVTLNLMEDPTRGDETFPWSVNVVATNEHDAYSKASTLQDNCLDLKVRRSSVFDYEVELLTKQ
jgi:hypothetical protein